MPRPEHWTEQEIPDQRGRTAVITGANSGIGYEAAQALARRGATVVLACRDLARAADAQAKIVESVPDGTVETVVLDLASLGSVRQAAAEIRGRCPSIDLLINNAGVMWVPHRLTEDGFELHFGTNHLGHFALTGLLLDLLLATPDSRVVNVASSAHRAGRIDFENLNGKRGYTRIGGYGQSKLANLMFSYELQRRLAAAGAGTVAVAAHPGAAATELVRHAPRGLRRLVRVGSRIVLQNARMGALPVLRAATDPAVSGGEYYGPGGLLGLWGHPVRADSSARSRDRDVQRRLWQVSTQLTGVTYPV